jgi:hypothetical protein
MNQITASRLTVLRDDLRTKRNARAARRSMERDLVEYTSQAQLKELQAIVTRYDGPDAALAQEVISRHVA